MGASWLAELALVICCVVVAEIAFRAGRVRRLAVDDLVRSQITAVQAATLGLLALFLAFTLSMAESRFSGRRTLIMDEANAIGTTYLRAELLTEPQRSESRELLRRYIDARRDFYAAGEDVSKIHATTATAERLHAEIWARAVAVGQAHPDWEVLSAYLMSLNEMIDLEATRLNALRTRLPETIVVLLVLVTLVAVGITGYASGLTGKRTLVAVFLMPMLLGFACVIVIDLDAPRVGLIRTGDAPMEHLQRQMQADRAAARAP
jgi:hypothetical protein